MKEADTGSILSADAWRRRGMHAPTDARLRVMISLAGEVVRKLPAPPVFFGLFAFGTLAVLLYLVLRLDRD